MAQTKFVLLNTRQPLCEAEIGPKAISLVRLSRSGLAVPPGLCITASIFRAHLECNKLPAWLRSHVQELAEASPDVRESLLSDFRQAIIAAPLAEQTRREVESL